MAPFGALFLTFGLIAIVMDPEDLISGWAPFYLAPVFCGLFFLTPAFFVFLRSQSEPVSLNVHESQHQQATNASLPPAVNHSTEKVVMGIFGSMFAIMAILSISILVLIVVVFLAVIGGLSELGIDIRF